MKMNKKHPVSSDRLLAVEDMVLRCINDSDLPRFIIIEWIGRTMCTYFFESTESASKAGFTGKNFNILARWLSPYHTILYVSDIR